MRILLIVTVTALCIGTAVAETKSEARLILDRAVANEKSQAALANALVELDALIVKNASDADAHYTRGWIL